MNAADIARLIATEQNRFANQLDHLSTADAKRYFALFKARYAARQLGGEAWERYEARHAATLAQGGPLADLLDTEAALQQARAWAAQTHERAA